MPGPPGPVSRPRWQGPPRAFPVCGATLLRARSAPVLSAPAAEQLRWPSTNVTCHKLRGPSACGHLNLAAGEETQGRRRRVAKAARPGRPEPPAHRLGSLRPTSHPVRVCAGPVCPRTSDRSGRQGEPGRGTRDAGPRPADSAMSTSSSDASQTLRLMTILSPGVWGQRQALPAPL